MAAELAGKMPAPRGERSFPRNRDAHADFLVLDLSVSWWYPVAFLNELSPTSLWRNR